MQAHRGVQYPPLENNQKLIDGSNKKKKTKQKKTKKQKKKKTKKKNRGDHRIRDVIPVLDSLWKETTFVRFFAS